MKCNKDKIIFEDGTTFQKGKNNKYSKDKNTYIEIKKLKDGVFSAQIKFSDFNHPLFTLSEDKIVKNCIITIIGQSYCESEKFYFEHDIIAKR